MFQTKNTLFLWFLTHTKWPHDSCFDFLIYRRMRYDRLELSAYTSTNQCLCLFVYLLLEYSSPSVPYWQLSLHPFVFIRIFESIAIYFDNFTLKKWEQSKLIILISMERLKREILRKNWYVQQNSSQQCKINDINNNFSIFVMNATEVSTEKEIWIDTNSAYISS